MTEVIRTRIDGPTATLEINRPDQRNALNEQVCIELTEGLRRLEANTDVRVAVITGAGDQAFCAGGDLSVFRGGRSDAAESQGRAVGEMFSAMERFGKPIIGRINGTAVAGGMGIALGCDIVIASEKASFGVPEIKVGLWPMMVMALLRRDLGHKRAMELMLTGRRISAEEALQWGIVSRVVPHAMLDATVAETAAMLAAQSRDIMALGRRGWHEIYGLPFDEALDRMAGRFVDVLKTDDAREGIAAFFEKRQPNFS